MSKTLSSGMFERDSTIWYKYEYEMICGRIINTKPRKRFVWNSKELHAYLNVAYVAVA